MTDVRSDIGPYCLAPLWVVNCVSGNALRVFAYLGAKHADKEGRAYPRRKLIADALAMSLASIDRAIKELEDVGALDLAPQFGPSGDRTANLYTLRFAPPRGRTAAATPPHDSSHPSSPVTTPLITRDEAITIPIEPDPMKIESLYARANEVAAVSAPEPDGPDLLASFPRMYARQTELHTTRPPTPAAQGAAHQLARDFGDAACIEVAADYDWFKHPNYLRTVLEERRNGRSPRLQTPRRTAGPTRGTPIPIDRAAESRRILDRGRAGV